MNNKTKGSIFLFLAALIWGSTFVWQSTAMEYIGPFTFNMCRSIVGFIVLAPVVVFLRKRNLKEHPKTDEEIRRINKQTIKAGLICGAALFVASSLQQIGISLTTVGKAGFITSLYIILVPVIGMFLGKKVPLIVWLCVIISLVGFYFLCIKEDLSIGYGDMFCLLCAFCFSVQILLIDHFTDSHSLVDPVMLSLMQFMTVGVLSAIVTVLIEKPDMASIGKAMGSILYAGALSNGMAYTFQIMGQKYTDPAIAPLIMSLESVIALFFGWFILGETMNSREILGSILVFTSVILSQMPSKDTSKNQ